MDNRKRSWGTGEEREKVKKRRTRRVIKKLHQINGFIGRSYDNMIMTPLTTRD